MAWYPNRLQWGIIWVTVLTSAHFWLKLRFSLLFGNGEGGWGLPAYLQPAIHRGQTTQLAAVILAIGVLLIWQTSRWHWPSKGQRQARVWIWLKKRLPSARTMLTAVVLGAGMWWLAVAISNLPPMANKPVIAVQPDGDIFDKIAAENGGTPENAFPGAPSEYELRAAPQRATKVSKPVDAVANGTEATRDACHTSGTAMAPHSMINGAESGYAGNGYGELTIRNGDTRDAAVIVANLMKGAEDRLIYVRAGMSATMGQIVPGTYKVTFQFGRIWDSKREDFLCDRSTEVFDKPLIFTETRDSDGVNYHKHRVTLNPVPNGNATTTQLNDALFLRRKPTP